LRSGREYVAADAPNLGEVLANVVRSTYGYHYI